MGIFFNTNWINTRYRKLYIGYSCCPGAERYRSNVAESLIFRGRNNPESNGLMIWHCGVCKQYVQSCLFFVSINVRRIFELPDNMCTVSRSCENGKKFYVGPDDELPSFWKGFIPGRAVYCVGPVDGGIPGATIVVRKPTRTDNGESFRDAFPSIFCKKNRSTTLYRWTKKKTESRWYWSMVFSRWKTGHAICQRPRPPHYVHDNFSKKSNDA